MKKLFVLLFVITSSLAQTANAWRAIANETIWPNAPYFREILVNDGAQYTEVRVYVSMGSVRIDNVMVLTENLHQLPLWQLRGDYRSPRMSEARFSINKLRSIRLEARSLETNRPSNLQVFVR
ncbi:hypothetical protein [Bdellovibrio sp. HCB2-146]|uniref:hypothetical protein n=1 Tax=Bdellovibrio sp. HCB2-146 TaxID=3394362 RepID=UPI0039BD311A